MQQYNLPTLQVGLGDLPILRNVIWGYLAYTRRTSKPTPESREQAHLLEGVYQRLIVRSQGAFDVRIDLQVQEIHALSVAILGFCAFVRQKVPASRDRDETLRDLEGFRQKLLAMLPA
jgi:hypothetical protein